MTAGPSGGLAPLDRALRVGQVRAARDAAGRPIVNGIEDVEVEDVEVGPGSAPGGTGVRLRLRFVHPAPGRADGVPGAGALRPGDLRVVGGERIRGVVVRDVATTDEDGGRVVLVTVDRRGDFSTYALVVDAPSARLDPLLAEVPVLFRAGCPSDVDCRPAPVGGPAPPPAPAIDYLARDFVSLRRLLLDRLAVLVPEWTERNPADVGVTLVELLAHVGDHLSYRQDAVATEAYLGTARLRVSAQRHAQLVDYRAHNGCNARTWLHLDVTEPLALPRGTACWTAVAGQPSVVTDSRDAERAARSGAVVFETLHDATLVPGRGRIELHDWGGTVTRLAAGATSATLRDPDRELALEAGDVLLLEEVLGERSGRVADADPAHRHVVRLTSVTPLVDALVPLPVLEVRWGAADALPFALSLARVVAHDPVDGVPPGGGQPVMVARGNLVPADHGATVRPDEALPPVPDPPVLHREPHRPLPLRQLDPPRRFRPALSRSPVTQAAPFAPTARSGVPSAAAALRQDPRSAVPVLRLADDTGREWTLRSTLVDSGPDDRHAVLEVESDGSAVLRFGDGVSGAVPPTGTRLRAAYRVGNGRAGGIGSDAIRHVFLPGTSTGAAPSGLDGAPVRVVRNPLPATGGTDPETVDDIRLRAPAALRRGGRRAVTPADYVRFMTERDDVRGATVSTRWTGRARTILLTVDRADGGEVDAAFRRALVIWLEPLRIAGHDVAVDAPRLVPLELALRVRLEPGVLRSDARAALEAEFSGRVLPGGRRGLFHRDGVTFGQPVFLSRLVAAAQDVDGVVDAVVTRFARVGTTDPGALRTGVLAFGRQEIPVLENDPDAPDRGVVRLELEGGR